jgi:hypothetical protein
MLKALLLLFFCAPCIAASAQGPNMDSILRQLPLTKNDSARFYLAFSALTESETNPVDDMDNAEIILDYGRKHHDQVCEVLGLACLGYDYQAFGNTTKGLAYSLMAKGVADKTNDYRLKTATYMQLSFNYLGLSDFAKAKTYALQGYEASQHVEPNLFTILDYESLGAIYLATNKIDSALIFTQRAYELSMSTGLKYYLCDIYEQLGSIQSKLNNEPLSLSYINLSLQEATAIGSSKYKSKAYHAIAVYYMNAARKDSAILYAKKSIAAVQNTSFSNMSILPAKMLLDVYTGNNVDSAFKYSELFRVANDSLYNFKKIQEAQLMTFEEDARQKQSEFEHLKSEEERVQNIQFVLIGLGILVLLTLYLLLSRSVITNTRMIEFLGAIALLIVFEFLNLLLHPFLERVTHHSPVLMLLALVVIASLLVPLHHRVEKWATHKLVEKNKAIRLAAAKKTIAKLESEVPTEPVGHP